MYFSLDVTHCLSGRRGGARIHCDLRQPVESDLSAADWRYLTMTSLDHLRPWQDRPELKYANRNIAVSRPGADSMYSQLGHDTRCHDEAAVVATLTPDTWTSKNENLERIKSICESNKSFDSCNLCKRLGPSCFGSSWTKLPFASLIELIRLKFPF